MKIQFIGDMDERLMLIDSGNVPVAVPSVNDTVSISDIFYKVYRIVWLVNFKGCHPTVYVSRPDRVIE